MNMMTLFPFCALVLQNQNRYGQGLKLDLDFNGRDYVSCPIIIQTLIRFLYCFPFFLRNINS